MTAVTVVIAATGALAVTSWKSTARKPIALRRSPTAAFPDVVVSPDT
ncbi:hypothetical protein ACIHFB_05130 [Streptomyces sp. NPDC051963]